MTNITTDCTCGMWTAIDADDYDGPGSPLGWGKTEAAAIADLMEQLEERDVADDRHRMDEARHERNH